MANQLKCPSCKEGIESFKVVREDRGTTTIRKNFCPSCGAFIDKFKFVNGREIGSTRDERSDKYSPTFTS